jgi:hypothetical protein
MPRFRCAFPLRLYRCACPDGATKGATERVLSGKGLCKWRCCCSLPLEVILPSRESNEGKTARRNGEHHSRQRWFTVGWRKRVSHSRQHGLPSSPSYDTGYVALLGLQAGFLLRFGGMVSIGAVLPYGVAPTRHHPPNRLTHTTPQPVGVIRQPVVLGFR